MCFFDVETREAWAFVGPFATPEAAQAATRASEADARLSVALEIGDVSERFVTELLATPGAAPPIGEPSYYEMRTVRFPSADAPRARAVLETYFLPTGAANGLAVLQFVRTDGGTDQIAFIGGYPAEAAARESTRVSDARWSAVLADAGEPPNPRERRAAFGGLKLDREARVVATARIADTEPAPPAPASMETVTVQAGDTLSAISLRRYGTVSRVDAIVRANADLIADPDLIFPGQVLKLP